METLELEEVVDALLVAADKITHEVMQRILDSVIE